MGKKDINTIPSFSNIQLSLDLFQNFYSIIRNKKPDRIITNAVIYQDFFSQVTASNDDLVKSLQMSLIIDVSYKVLRFVIESGATSWSIAIPLSDVNPNDFDDFLVGIMPLEQFLCSTAMERNVSIDVLQDYPSYFGKALLSWDRCIQQFGFDDSKLLQFDDSQVFSTLRNEHVVWYYGSSCSGKTFMGIREVKKMHLPITIVYNPCSSADYEYDLIKLILCYGENVALLVDDLQCDTEKANEVLSLIVEHKESFDARNIYVFLISWASLLQEKTFAGYQSVINTIESSPHKYIAELKQKVSNERLRSVCGNNLALLNIAGTIVSKGEVSDPENTLFEAFVKTKSPYKISVIYRLCVLGTFAYLVEPTFLKSTVSSDELITIKSVNGKYYAGHKEICRFLSTYISDHTKELGLESLPQQDAIILEYIQSVDSNNQWKVIKQLIGEQSVEDLQNVSPIWKGLHLFEKEISMQTEKDPTWNDTPSSMYFVLKVASLLGVLADYKAVINNFCNKFEVIENSVVVKYDSITTTNDFEQIKLRMIEEDSNTPLLPYESGYEFDCYRAHKNWLLGLVVGLKNELLFFGHQDLYNAAVCDLFIEQKRCSGGYWYPQRVPWVSARVLIGLSQAGYTSANDQVSKGIGFLINCLGNSDCWNAHTGGWNTPYETSALCLEAIYNSSKYQLRGEKKKAVDRVVQYLLNTKEEWIKKDKVVDGTATACCLLKNYEHSPELIEYIKGLCTQRIYEIIKSNRDMNLNEQQSCEYTQIAWYVMDFCWDVLRTHLPDLLKKFISRSLQKTKKVGEQLMSRPTSIFISYCVNAKSVNRIKKVSQYLRNQGYDVRCYADEPIGTNNVSFMQKAPESDLILVMGSKEYKDKALKINSYSGKGSGVFFENLILSQMFLENNLEKVIPVAFESGTSFEESFPPPFSTNKGLNCKRITEACLQNLVNEIEEKMRRKK